MSEETNKPLMTSSEVAQLLQVEEGTVKQWVKAQRIPVVRLSSRCLRFRRSDIDAWLDGQLRAAA
jgi:excisionase family DNA binding protein